MLLILLFINKHFQSQPLQFLVRGKSRLAEDDVTDSSGKQDGSCGFDASDQWIADSVVLAEVQVVLERIANGRVFQDDVRISNRIPGMVAGFQWTACSIRSCIAHGFDHAVQDMLQKLLTGS